MPDLTAIPPLPLLLTFLGLAAIIALRYVLISGLFYWLLWARPAEKVRAIKLMRGRPERGVVRREIGWSLVSSLIYAAPAAVVFELWRLGGSAVYTDVSRYPLWYLPLIAAVVVDLCRAGGRRVRVMASWRFGRVHRRKPIPVVVPAA